MRSTTTEKGHVVWWASATPAPENGSLARANDLDLPLNSIGPHEGHHFYWDESLHGGMCVPSVSYVAGPAQQYRFFIGLAALGVLIVFSFSRREWPVAQLAGSRRALRRLNFLDALGSLYRTAGAASSTAVAVALELLCKQLQPASLPACARARWARWSLKPWVRRSFPDADARLEAFFRPRRLRRSILERKS